MCINPHFYSAGELNRVLLGDRGYAYLPTPYPEPATEAATMPTQKPGHGMEMVFGQLQCLEKASGLFLTGPVMSP